MKKKYRYSGFEKDGWPSQKKALIYSVIFTFTEIGNTNDKVSETRIRIEIPNSMIMGWKANTKISNPSDDDLIKVLAGIAKEDGLKKSHKLIEVNGDAYPEGIGKFEEYGMEEGCEFTIP